MNFIKVSSLIAQAQCLTNSLLLLMIAILQSRRLSGGESYLGRVSGDGSHACYFYYYVPCFF